MKVVGSRLSDLITIKTLSEKKKEMNGYRSAVANGSHFYPHMHICVFKGFFHVCLFKESRYYTT